MMMTMIVFNKQQYISTVARQTIASVRVQVKSGVDGTMVLTGVWLVLYWVSARQKISPNNNTIQYLWILPTTQ